MKPPVGDVGGLPMTEVVSVEGASKRAPGPDASDPRIVHEQGRSRLLGDPNGPGDIGVSVDGEGRDRETRWQRYG